MSGNTKRVLVAGAGAIGGITGGYISKSDADVILYDRNEKHVNAVNDNGLIVSGVRGRKRFYLKAVSDLKELSWEPDYVLVGVKSAVTRLLMEDLVEVISDETVVISLQNGINEYIIEEYVGAGRVYGVVTGWGATNKGFGKLAQTSFGDFIIGRLDGRTDKKVREVRKYLSFCSPTSISTNIIGRKYSKLMMNGIINTLGAITGVALGDFVLDERGAFIFIKMWNEEAAILKSVDVEIKPFNPFLTENALRARNAREFYYALSVLYFVWLKVKGLTSSMLQDIKKGIRSENRYLLGHFIEINENRIPIPFIEKAYEMVEEIEDSKREICMENLDELLKAEEINPDWHKLYNMSLNALLARLNKNVRWF